MQTILLTGGRAPATLDLARLFKRAGYRVLVGDSLRWTLCRFSNAVDRFVVWPSPRFEHTAFKHALLSLIREEQVDLLVPTCEEIYYVAAIERDVSALCQVFTPSLNEIRRLHSKFHFVELAQTAGVEAPTTVRVTSPEELKNAVADDQRFQNGVVIKPEFSRFATQTLVKPTGEALAQCNPTKESPWVVQAFVPGKQFASYTIFQDGEPVVHADYPLFFTAGRGAAVAFEASQHAGICEWVFRMGRSLRYTGQLAFDFIETEDGEVVGIECNPRLTSGIHLFADQPDIAHLFFQPQHGDRVVTPNKGSGAFLGLPFLQNGWPAFKKPGLWVVWKRVLKNSRNVMWDASDLGPWFAQGFAFLPYLPIAMKEKRSLIAATTADIEWNGDPIV